MSPPADADSSVRSETAPPHETSSAAKTRRSDFSELPAEVAEVMEGEAQGGFKGMRATHVVCEPLRRVEGRADEGAKSRRWDVFGVGDY